MISYLFFTVHPSYSIMMDIVDIRITLKERTMLEVSNLLKNIALKNDNKTVKKTQTMNKLVFVNIYTYGQYGIPKVIIKYPIYLISNFTVIPNGNYTQSISNGQSRDESNCTRQVLSNSEFWDSSNFLYHGITLIGGCIWI